MSTGTGKTSVVLAGWSLVGLPTPILFVTKAIGRHVFPRDAEWVLGEEFAPGILWAGEAQGPGVHFAGGKNVSRTTGARSLSSKTYTSLPLALSERLGVVTNYEVLASRIQELVEVPWKVVVFDEAHELKGGYQKPKRDLDGNLHLLRYHRAKALAGCVRARGGYVWTSTATPIVDRRRDLFAQLDISCPGEFGSAWDFLHRFCSAHINQWGGLDSTGTSNTQELMQRIRRSAVIIRREDVADQLPPVQRDVCVVTPQTESYRSMGGSLETALDRAASMTEPFVLDDVAEYLTGGLKVVVVTTRRRFAYDLATTVTSKAFLSRLPRHMREIARCDCVTGEVEPRKRVEIIQRFNGLDSGPAVLIATIKSIRESVDLHRVNGIIIGAFPDRPGDLVQLEGRIGRLSGWPVTIRYLVAEGTVAERYKEMLLDKMSDIVSLGTDTQGVDGSYKALIGGYLDEDAIIAGLREFLSRDGERTSKPPEGEAA